MDKRLLIAVILIGVLIGLGYYIYQMIVRPMQPTFERSTRLVEWLKDPSAHPDWPAKAGTRCTPGAPFVMPTDGLIGYLWDDSFKVGKRHQGIDIFGGADVGKTPVVAAYAGYLTRLSSWKSAVIVRVPQDPLQPGRQIWLYYTHMADPYGNSYISTEFPPGTIEKYVEAGTRLGYQGNYTGDAANPSGIHLHFSIVLDDGQGKFRNELDINNTLDPSPYLGLALNARTSDGGVILCQGQGY
jgi:murein DD-endopeptidase MepM/ murein hydrolase activator NlpD